MRQRIVRGVSFGPKDMALLEWAEKQGSFSAYVKLLIRRDMDGGHLGQLVERLLRDGPQHSKTAPGEGAAVTEEQLRGLF